MSYKRERSFKRFEKSYEEKRKENPILVYLGLRYTHKKLNFACKIFVFKKCLFEYENQFAVEKKYKKFLGGISKILFVVAIKKIVIQFPYMEIVGLLFFFFRKQK